MAETILNEAEMSLDPAEVTHEASTAKQEVTTVSGPAEPGLFFADSDDEEDVNGKDIDMLSINVEETPAVLEDEVFEAPNPPPSKRLFLGDSDDEADNYLKAVISGAPQMHDPDDDAEISTSEDLPRASSVSSFSSDHHSAASSPKPPSKRVEPPTKRRRVSPPAPLSLVSESPFSSAYLGSFLVGNAWSTVKGKGYIKPGDSILVERDDQDEFQPSKATSSAKGSGTAKKKKGEGMQKQISIASMLKPSQPKMSKKKADTVVRLTNSRGFEFGRLPSEMALWISKLLDMGLIEFRECTVIDCPPLLHSGADLVVSLSVYILASAFRPTTTGTSLNDASTVMFGEGQETLEEQQLRERKSSLLRLFDVIGLKPQDGADFARFRVKSDEELKELALKRMAKQPLSAKTPGRSAQTEIVGDGEEVEVEEGEDLSENELDMIYKRAQQNDRIMGESEPTESFTMTLRGYQKQALSWMESLESGEISVREATSMHPLWCQYVFPSEPRDGVIDLTSDEKPFYFNPYSGELSLAFPKAERKCKGGILADVGMGKTIMLSALIQTSRGPDVDDPVDELRANGKNRQLKLNHAFQAVSRKTTTTRRRPSATLIVAPTSLLSQWAEELQRSSKDGTFKVLVWHGHNRLDPDVVIEDDHDGDNTIKVIITSYGVLASEHAKLEKSSSHRSPVFDIEWFRVVLDEAHHCKSRSSKTARAVYALKARRRWAVTGTPIVNKLEDLFSLLKFLQFAPWSDYSFFRSFITLPFLARDPKAIEIVQVILESVLLRREKNMLDTDGKRIVELPAKEITVDHLEFSLLERKIYDSIFVQAKRNFERLDAQGLVGKNYTHILAMLMRLRRAVLHPNLVLSANDNETVNTGNGDVDVDALIKSFSEGRSPDESASAFADGVLANISHDVSPECPICLDTMQTPMIIPSCMHQCCKDCIVAYFMTCEQKGEEGRCPTCSHGPIKENELVEVVRSADQSDSGETSAVSFRRNDFRSSTKLEALIQNLRRLQDQDPCFRAVVFSQFTSFLDLIEVALQREGLDQYRFDGSMDMKKRNHAVSEFKAPSRKPKVLIISLKAGGVGLNLTVANHVFMMDCWWNAATENQAIDRVHRIGQGKTVYVTHFIIANTIEGRILQIQKRKTAIVKEAFRGKGPGEADPESIENLKIMFGAD